MPETDIPPVLSSLKDGVLTLTLNRPRQHNCLNEALLGELKATLSVVGPDVRAVVLRANGKSFSTGGDLKAFLAHAENPEALRAYAARLVGTLNDVILALIDLPMPVISLVQGPVTGGSLGFVLASDLSAMAPDAFVQPYYGAVGFGPDGGWTALLPDRIGAPEAAAILASNRRLTASEAGWLKLVNAVEENLDEISTFWTQTILDQEAESLAANKRLLWPAERRARVATALEAERQQFVALVGRPVVRERLAAFMDFMTSERGKHVFSV